MKRGSAPPNPPASLELRSELQKSWTISCAGSFQQDGQGVNEASEAPKLQQFRKIKAASAFPNLRWDRLKRKSQTCLPQLGNPGGLGSQETSGTPKISGFASPMPHSSLFSSQSSTQTTAEHNKRPASSCLSARQALLHTTIFACPCVESYNERWKFNQKQPGPQT